MIIVIIMLLLFSKVLGIGKKSNTDTSDSQQTEQSADEEDDSSSASQGNTVNMPSLLGKTYAEARTVLEELGLKIERGESEKSNQYSAGQIIAQSEESGNSVKVGTTVTVTLAQQDLLLLQMEPAVQEAPLPVQPPRPLTAK